MTPIQGRWRRWKTRAHRTIPSTSIATNTPMSSCRLGVRLKDGRGERWAWGNWSRTVSWARRCCPRGRG
jgi:hypothetical protein